MALTKILKYIFSHALVQACCLVGIGETPLFAMIEEDTPPLRQQRFLSLLKVNALERGYYDETTIFLGPIPAKQKPSPQDTTEDTLEVNHYSLTSSKISPTSETEVHEDPQFLAQRLHAFFTANENAHFLSLSSFQVPEFPEELRPFLSPNSSFHVVHHFKLAEQEGSLKTLFKNGVCSLVGKKTTFKTTLSSKATFLFSMEAEFRRPFSAKVLGISYGFDPNNNRISCYVQVKVPGFVEPQFSEISASYLEREDGTLSRWMYIENGEIYGVKRHPTLHSPNEFEANDEYVYNPSWSQAFIFPCRDIEGAQTFLSLCLDHVSKTVKAKKDEKIGVVSRQERDTLLQGFYRVASCKDAKEPYVFVQKPSENSVSLWGVQTLKVSLKKDGSRSFTTPLLLLTGNVPLITSNISFPEDLTEGFYRLDMQKKERVPPFFNLTKEDEEISPLVVSLREQESPYTVEVRVNPEANFSMMHALEAAAKPYITTLMINQRGLEEELDELNSFKHLQHLVISHYEIVGEGRDFWNTLASLPLVSLDVEKSTYTLDSLRYFKTVLLAAPSSLQHLRIKIPDEETFSAKIQLAAIIGGGLGAEVCIKTFIGSVGVFTNIITLTGSAAATTIVVSCSELATLFFAQDTPHSPSIDLLREFLTLPSLKSLTVSNIPRGKKGCQATSTHLEEIRESLRTVNPSLPSVSITIINKNPTFVDSDWDILSITENMLSRTL